MKKILAIVLAAVMVVGMGITGFAAWADDQAFTAEKSVSLEAVPGGTVKATINFSDIDATGREYAVEKIDSISSQRNAWANPTNLTGPSANVTAIAPVIADFSSSVSSNSVTVTMKVSDRAKAGDWVTASVDVVGTDVVSYKWGNTPTEADNGDATLTFSFYVDIVDKVESPNAPKITGPTTQSLKTGYAATYSSAFTIEGEPAPTVTIEGDSKITWNEEKNRLDIAAGLAEGTYKVVLTATNSEGTATHTYTLTVSKSGTTTSKIVSTTAKISNFASDMSLAFGYADDVGRYQIYDVGTIRPSEKEKLVIWLYTDMFTWNDGNTYLGWYLGSQTVRNSKLAARTQVAEGSKAIDSTTIDYDGGRAYIKVKFVEEWVSVDDLDFEFTTYLAIDGKRRDTEGQGVTFYGKLENYEILVYSSDDYVDLSLGEVANAQDFVNNIEVDLGSGVSIFTKFFKGKKYYGTATREKDEAADVVFAKYPDVDNVVRLKTVGLNSTGDIVKLDTDYSDYYVYDGDMNYLGQSSGRLPFSSRYYLANRKLDVEDVGGDYEEPEDPGDYVPPADSGGDSGPSNANANPGTGR